MARKEIGAGWDRNNRNAINDNFEELYNVQDRAIAEATEAVINDSKLIWQRPVPTFNDLATTYPNPEKGYTVMARDTGIVYRWDGQWKEIQQIDAGPVNEVDTRLSAHLADDTIHKTSDVIRTETETKLKVEVVSSSESESPEQGRVVFDASLEKFLGGNGSEWV